MSSSCLPLAYPGEPSGQRLTVLVLVALLCPLFAAKDTLHAADDLVDFNRQIRPLLSDNCFSCHGPDAEQRQADLRLDRREAAIEQGAIDPNSLDQSPLLARIMTTDDELRMPPPKSNKRLTDVQKALLARWIEQGAHYSQHWSFAPPVRPDIATPEKAIDLLLEKQLDQAGLAFSPRAEPTTLARRLALDLIGLPPTRRQVEILTRDPSDAGVRTLVEQLLASPHYGERMAIAWLDLVRFADTIGYHSDTPRNVFPYRDYVIDAFNSNKPFDQFTVEQVAGDLLPDATQQQKVASCFNRLLLTTEEGGAQPKDYEARYMADRVRAIGTTWLGLTIGCSQCHDHKFDPLTMHDFYSMGAFFADIDEAIIGKREEGLSVPDRAQAIKIQQLKVVINELSAELLADHPQFADQRADWERHQLALDEANNHWATLSPSKVVAQSLSNNAKSKDDDSKGANKAEANTARTSPGLPDTSNDASTSESRVSVFKDQSILIGGPRPDKVDYRLSIPFAEAVNGVRGLRLEALPHESLPNKGSGRADNGNFVLTEVVAQIQPAAGKKRSLKFQSARASLEQTVGAEKHPDKRWSAQSTIDGDAKGKQWGWAILPDVTQPQQLQLQFAEPVDLNVGDALLIEMRNNHGNNGHTLGHFRWSLSCDPLALQAPLGDAQATKLIAAIRTESPKRTLEQEQLIRIAFNQSADALLPLREKLTKAQTELTAFEASLPRCLISKSLAKPRTVRILPRGNWLDESGPIVAPKLPGFLTAGQPTSDRPLTRLDLARWLVAKDNPLTARVFVNRLWKHFFGAGISKNLDDVGAQGDAPANSALMDFLATEFVRSGWDVKHIVRLIVLSHAYQQSSAESPELLERDPENRLVSRQSRFRLPAELVRDNALAIAGMLAPKVGGPSVKPYQPEGYWENLNFPVRSYTADLAPLQNRRGLYVWWQRSFVHPSMLAFDAPTREECTADRPQSNIPQQALVLLNDPTYVEAAAALATRMISGDLSGENSGDSHATVAERIARAFQVATAREPTVKELELLVSLQADTARDYLADSELAETLWASKSGPIKARLVVGSVPPSVFAAYFQVARAILNLHEVITRS